jgi:6-pyruvoyl-tetrahydropterin synthase
LASSSYTAPLDATGTRSAVGLASANLDTQLGNIPSNVWAALTTALTAAGTIGKRIVDFLDVAISSRLASTPPLDAAGTRSAIGLASANLDSQFDAIPTASENASAVEAQLALPLGNMDVAVSTRSTFNPAMDTVAQVTLVDTTTNLTNPPDVPTTAEIATAVAAELDPTLAGIDNNVLSRLAAVDYTTPPTAQQNAEAVEAQLATPLGNMDVAVSTRSTFNPATDTVAQVTLVDTTTNLTNPPVVPTPEQIATAVANELDPTLTEIDNNVLSRLAAEDYTTPPTAEQNAEAVRVELTPELDRVSNCATVDTTGQQIQNALSP